MKPYFRPRAAETRGLGAGGLGGLGAGRLGGLGGLGDGLGLGDMLGLGDGLSDGLGGCADEGSGGAGGKAPHHELSARRGRSGRRWRQKSWHGRWRRWG